MSLHIACATFDSEDAAALAEFWSALLERPVDPDASPEFATIGRDDHGGELTLFFARVPDKNPGKNTVHLDLTAKDWTAQVDRAVDLGAKRLGDYDEFGYQWTTLADPEGNLFDIGRHG